MSLIQGSDDIMTAALKLVQGNIGAANAVGQAMQQATTIDPDSALGPLSVLFELDTLAIYGPRIWLLWKDIAGQDAVRFTALLRSVQLGIMDASELQAAIGDGITTRCKGMPPQRVDEILKQVRQRLPNFGRLVSTS